MNFKTFMNPELGINRMAAESAVAVGSVAQGAATVNTAVTNAATHADEDYLKNDLEKKLVLIAPSSTPIDTITREIGNTRRTKSVETGGWEVAVRDVEDAVDGAVSASSASQVGNIVVCKGDIWQPGDTLVVFDPSLGQINYYVEAVTRATRTLSVHHYDYTSGASGAAGTKFPALADGAKIIRLSKAMSELDASTDAIYSIPSKRTNYCQIHMAQVEESVLHALHEKEVAYDYTTIKEQTIFDLKWRMEMSNLWGQKGYFNNSVTGKAIYTSDGLWNQIENLKALTPAAMGNAEWISFTKDIFVGNNGSERRIAIVGPDLMAFWANVPEVQKQLTAENTELVLGVKFQKVITGFGELLVKCASNTFLGGNAYKGIVIDPAYLRRDVFEQLNTTPLDYDATGQRRVKAERILENYCLYVENQPVHSKIAAAPAAIKVGAKLETPVVSVTAVTKNSIALAVNAVFGANKYQYSKDGGAWTDFTGTTASLTSLSASTAYNIKVKAVPAANSDLYYDSAAAEVNVTTPAA